MSDSEVEDANPIPFIATEWIGSHRPVPEPNAMPAGLARYFSDLKEVPDTVVAAYYPDKQLNVEHLLTKPLLAGSYALLDPQPKKCFSNMPPNENIENACKRKLPSFSLVKKLDLQFRQAILDGMQSLIDPANPGAYLPLWFVRFWLNMWEMNAVQDKWRRALSWLDEKEGTMVAEKEREVLRMARRFTDVLRWSEDTDIPGANRIATDSFADYLSNDTRMSTTHINMMFSHISDRVERIDDLDTLVVVETLRFWKEIDKAKSIKHFNAPATSRFLRRLETRVSKNEIDNLIFPARMDNEEHWITLKLDFMENTVSYGDSLTHRGIKAPTDVVKKVQWWLKSRFQSNFKVLGDQLLHGQQNDYTDCGIVCANTAAVEVFEGEMIWTDERKTTERANWFVLLVRKHINNINTDPKRQPYPTLPLSAGELARSQFDTSDGALQPASGTMSLSNLLNPSANVSNACDEPQVSDEPCAESLNNVPDSQIMHPLLSQTQHSPGQPATDAEPMKVKMKKRDRSPSIKDTQIRKAVKTSHTSIATSSPPVGRSASTVWARLRNEKYKSGEITGMSSNLIAFRQKIQQLDEHAVIQDPKQVRHFKCGKTLTMKYPFDVGNFKTHVSNCSGPPKSAKLPGGGMKKIGSYFTRKDTTTATRPKPDGPCPGLDSQKYPAVETYLDRTGSLGGGASSITRISQEMFGKPFRKLSAARKKKVLTAQTHEWKWRNDHNAAKVYSTSCSKISLATDPSFRYKADQVTRITVNDSNNPDAENLPCMECQSILANKGFKNACKVSRPLDKNYKYINFTFRTKRLAEIYGRCLELREIMESKDLRTSPLLKYVQGVISKRYREDNIFVSLIEAMVLKHKRAERGVGLQGMRYNLDLVEFSQIIYTHSPRAYKQIKEVFPLPEPRTLQIQRAHQPRFPVGIQPRTFQLVEDTLKKLSYTGPVALSCDDSKLLASFRPYYDEDRKGYFVMGHVGEPYQLLDHEAFQEVVENQKLLKATKLRLFCLQVPLPKIATIIVAALSIPESLTAHNLFEYLWEVLQGLLRRKIRVASYASDGSNVERSLSRLLESNATRSEDLVIKHPADDGTQHGDIIIPIFFFGTQPLAIIQDPKHLLKTFRNQIFWGSRLVTLPGHVVHFAQVKEITYHNNSPLYRRDVEKADRQDDNAATRLFCGDTLRWLSGQRPEHRGLIIFLFICGELIDAYQSRTITLHIRVRMVLRAHFFFEFWEKFLEVGGYSKARHYVSSQCAGITRTLIRGFLQALVIYRDHIGGRYPFLPWLLSTEVVEHVFGVCRQIIKDFTMLDFHLMAPKLFIQLRQTFFASRTSDGKARASGYAHTHTDFRGINLPALSVYPINEEIQEAAGCAYDEAHSIFAYLGVTAHQLYGSVGRLPSIASWLQEEDEAELCIDKEEPRYPDGGDFDPGADSDSDDGIDYQRALDILQEQELDLAAQDENRAMNLTYATIALSINEQNTIAELPELDEDGMTEAFADDAARIAASLPSPLVGLNTNSTVSLPPVNIREPSNPFSIDDPSTIDISELVHLRFLHQTRQAATGVRTSILSPPSLQDESQKEKPLTERQTILRCFKDILKQQEERGIGTGLERMARWRHAAPGGNSGVVNGMVAAPLTGNSANAATTAKATATKNLTKRKNIFSKASLPEPLWNARISPEKPLQVANWNATGGYGFALASNAKLGPLVLCKVFTLYSKGGGTNGKHGWVSDSSIITATSNIGVQVYEYHFGALFYEKPPSHAFPQLPCFDFLPSTRFLCALEEVPIVTESGIRISSVDLSLFRQLKKKSADIVKAVKVLNGRKKAGENEACESDEDI